MSKFNSLLMVGFIAITSFQAQAALSCRLLFNKKPEYQRIPKPDAATSAKRLEMVLNEWTKGNLIVYDIENLDPSIWSRISDFGKEKVYGYEFQRYQEYTKEITTDPRRTKSPAEVEALNRNTMTASIKAIMKSDDPVYAPLITSLLQNQWIIYEFRIVKDRSLHTRALNYIQNISVQPNVASNPAYFKLLETYVKTEYLYYGKQPDWYKNTFAKGGLPERLRLYPNDTVEEENKRREQILNLLSPELQKQFLVYLEKENEPKPELPTYTGQK